MRKSSVYLSLMRSTKDDIIKLPNSSLRIRSKRVGLVDKNIRDIIDKMSTATLDWEDNREHEVGVALAAIQMNLPLRIVIIRNDFDNKNDRTFNVFINPEIVKLEGSLIEDFEGCLSISNLYGKVPRHERVKVKALDLSGKQIRITADGFLARIFQHEIDHTNGIVFIDHIASNPEAFFQLQEDGHLSELDYENDIRENKDLWH